MSNEKMLTKEDKENILSNYQDQINDCFFELMNSYTKLVSLLEEVVCDELECSDCDNDYYNNGNIVVEIANKMKHISGQSVISFIDKKYVSNFRLKYCFYKIIEMSITNDLNIEQYKLGNIEQFEDIGYFIFVHENNNRQVVFSFRNDEKVEFLLDTGDLSFDFNNVEVTECDGDCENCEKLFL